MTVKIYIFIRKVGFGMSVYTSDLLKSLGFKEDNSIVSDPPGGLSIDLGNFKLSASFVINRWCQEIVLLSGIMSISRSIYDVESEMPREVESWEQGVAWVTWCLDKHGEYDKYNPTQPIKWLADGRQNFYLLPWERERLAYENRPNCYVKREWVRVALRNLSKQIALLDDEVSVIFQFDGNILTICYEGLVLAMPAYGSKWKFRYLIKAGTLRQLPKRLMSQEVEFSVWNSDLTIGRYRYKDVKEIENQGEL